MVTNRRSANEWRYVEFRYAGALTTKTRDLRVFHFKRQRSDTNQAVVLIVVPMTSPLELREDCVACAWRAASARCSSILRCAFSASWRACRARALSRLLTDGPELGELETAPGELLVIATSIKTTFRYLRTG